MGGDKTADIPSEGLAGFVGQPKLQESGIEAEGLLSAQTRVESRRRELGLLRGGVEFGRVGEELRAGRHQVLTDSGESSDVFALPEHDLVGLLGGFFPGQAIQRRLQAHFEAA